MICQASPDHVYNLCVASMPLMQKLTFGTNQYSMLDLHVEILAWTAEYQSAQANNTSCNLAGSLEPLQ